MTYYNRLNTSAEAHLSVEPSVAAGCPEEVRGAALLLELHGAAAALVPLPPHLLPPPVPLQQRRLHRLVVAAVRHEVPEKLLLTSILQATGQVVAFPDKKDKMLREEGI